MAFEEDFNELERMLASKCGDYEKMRATLQAIRQLHEFVRFMGPTQDRLYASIAKGHRKVLLHLEAGDTAAAMCEAAKSVAWFYRRFEWCEPEALLKAPEVAEELRAVRELLAHSQILKEAVNNPEGHGLP